MNEIEKPTQCNCCSWETSDLKYYSSSLNPAWLCEVCATTMIGSMYTARSYQRDEFSFAVMELSKNMAACTNMILAAMKEHKP